MMWTKVESIQLDPTLSQIVLKPVMTGVDEPFVEKASSDAALVCDEDQQEARVTQPPQ
jgi:hypothetical protein